MDRTARTTAVGSAHATGVLVAAVALVLGSASVATQSGRASQVQSFEVASVRPNKTEGFSLRGVQTLPGGSVVAIDVPLRRIIAWAYGLEAYQPLQGKSPLLDDKFDVTAKAADATLSRLGEVGPLNLMMQNLLAQRFKLVVRWQDRQQSGYALIRLKTDGNLGPGIRPTDLECPHPPASGPTAPVDNRRCILRIIDNELTAEGQRIPELARLLSGALQLPVVDRTGLAGSFNVRIAFDARQLPAFARGGGPPPVTNGADADRPTGLPSLFIAIQEQLGLKLEQQRLTMPVLIVEHVEPPSEN